MNIFIGITGLILCMIFSYYKANKYVKRRQFYFEFYTFNKKLKTEIDFTQKTLTGIINEYQNSDFIDAFRFYLKYNIFEFDNNYLGEEDKNFYKNYLSIIGSGDRISQIQFIDNASEQIDIKYKNSQEEEKVYKKLYYKIGFLIGLMVFILFL